MKGLRKVVWAEGVFLGQQHFQAWDRYQFHTQALRSRMYEPYHWGINKLVWNDAALENGRLELSACQGILPDGRVIDYQRELDGAVYLDLKQHSGERLSICVLMPRNETAQNITGYSNSDRLAGWETEYADLEDQYDTSRVREVLLAKPNLQLQLSEATHENVVSMELCRVVREYDDVFRFDDDFVPPALSLAASPKLGQSVSNLMDMVQTQFRPLQEQRLKLGEVSNMTGAELADFMLQAELVELLSELRGMNAHPQQSPFGIYHTLCRYHDRIALHLSPEKVPHSGEYRHDDPGASFAALFESFRTVLGAERKRPDSGIVLNSPAPGRFESSTISDAASEQCAFYLAVSHRSDDPSWVTRFPNYFKIGAPGQMDNMIASAVPGLPLVHTTRVPQKIRIKSGYEYFMLDKNSDAWNDIRREGSFSAFCLGEFVSAEVELLVIEE